MGLIQSSGCFVDQWSGGKEDLGKAVRGHVMASAGIALTFLLAAGVVLCLDLG